MSEIKAGTMVWVKDAGGSWYTTPMEYARNINGKHWVWSTGGAPIGFDEASLTNPYQPKQPEWMPEGNYELWEVMDSETKQGYMVYAKPDGSMSVDMPSLYRVFHSFAVQAGDGKICLMNSPVWFTWDGATLYHSFSPNSYQAKLLGAVMKKAVE
jgi:hypothetical protein